jgi:hypothetical protein
MAFPKRPALRGFVDGRWALVFTFLYPVLFSNGPILANFPQKGRTFAFHFFGASVAWIALEKRTRRFLLRLAPDIKSA